MFQLFYLHLSLMFFGIFNPFKRFFNEVSREKVVLFTFILCEHVRDVSIVRFFLLAESWLVNSNVEGTEKVERYYYTVEISCSFKLFMEV